MPAPQRPNAQIAPKPYDVVNFPKTPPPKGKPIGHDRYFGDRLHGILHLQLEVGTGVHVSTGSVVMGSDVGEKIPLIKTMMQTGEKQPVIPGSSLKGVVRSIYEAITNSTLGVVTGRERNKMPPERLPCNKKEQLCPASQLFGALDWQGLISFQDARCIGSKFTTGFMPSMYRPRPDQRRAYFHPVARKFYYHAVKPVSGGDRGVPVQQIGQKQIFETQLHFKNLTQAELGTLLIAFGQDQNYPFALKVGAGKPIGLGTLVVSLKRLVIPQSPKERYQSYESNDQELTGKELQTFIQKVIAESHAKKLVEIEQLKQLQKILKYPTERPAPNGMY